MLEDHYNLEDYFPNILTPWLLRLILDDRLTVDKKLGMADIATKIKEEYDVSGGVVEGGVIEGRREREGWACRSKDGGMLVCVLHPQMALYVHVGCEMTALKHKLTSCMAT